MNRCVRKTESDQRTIIPLSNQDVRLSIQYLSYLLRVWREGSGSSCIELRDWQVELRHIQTGQTWQFDSLQEFASFLESHTRDEAVPITLEN